MEILKERDMDLLSRKRVSIMIENKGSTPSRSELINEIAKKFKVTPELVIIKHIYQQFGRNKTKLIVNIYTDKAKMERFEHANLLKKHAAKEQPKKEKKEEAPSPTVESPKVEEKEAPVDASAEEAPKETPKETPVEEPKAEEKPVSEVPKVEEKTGEKPAEKVEEKKVDE